jgi:hypothetical protein
MLLLRLLVLLLLLLLPLCCSSVSTPCHITTNYNRRYQLDPSCSSIADVTRQVPAAHAYRSNDISVKQTCQSSVP